MKTEFLGLQLQSPLIIGSGPLSYGAEGMIALHRAGAGAVVTKTIRNTPAVNPEPHIHALNAHSMINAEKWSDYPGEQWAEQEIPRALEAGVRVIASVGHTPEEVVHWLPSLDQTGVPLFELVSYDSLSMTRMVREAKKLTEKPVLAKISPNWPDPVRSALDALEAGADGITAMDSLGPVLSIDIRTGRPALSGESGMAWLTGSSIKPLILRYVAEIASKTTKPVVGLGGVMNGEDALEMLMAGAAVVGICTYPMLKGLKGIGRLNTAIETLLKELGYETIQQVSGAALPHLFQPEVQEKTRLFIGNPFCRLCGLCVQRCPYNALEIGEKGLTVDHQRCRRCGLCRGICPENNLALVKEGV